MEERISKSIYVLACIASGILLFLAATAHAGVFEGFVKLGAGIAVYYIGRDILRYRKKP